jgi:hypothetical protein
LRRVFRGGHSRRIKILNQENAGGAQERRDGTRLGLLKIVSGGWSDPLREATKRDEERSGASWVSEKL